MRGRYAVESGTRRAFVVLWIAFFFQGMSPGFWFPALTNILTARGLGGWVPVVFMVHPLCSLVAPLVGGALADQRVPANRLYAGSAFVAAILLALAFTLLARNWHPLWFVAAIAAYALSFVPTWGLLATISLNGLQRSERTFPLVRVGATFGWVAGGLATSFLLRADTSPAAGFGGAVALLGCGLVGLLLPHTPSLGNSDLTWRDRCGLGAFRILRQRDHAVFFLVTMLFSAPLAAFYMYGPEFLKVLGDRHPAGTMTIAQVLEVFSLLALGALMTRFRIKTLLLWALGLSVLRFGMSAHAAGVGVIGWHIAGVALHGVCFTFYFITAQVFLDRRVEPRMKGQAQGLLALASGGVGTLVGTLASGWLRHACVDAQGRGWDLFWWILTAMIALCFVIFALFYQGRRAAAAEP